MFKCQSQWLRGLRYGSAVACLLGLWVRILPGVALVEVFSSGWSLVQRSPTECCVSGCDREASIKWRAGPLRTVAPLKGRVFKYETSKKQTMKWMTKNHKIESAFVFVLYLWFVFVLTWVFLNFSGYRKNLCCHLFRLFLACSLLTRH